MEEPGPLNSSFKSSKYFVPLSKISLLMDVRASGSAADPEAVATKLALSGCLMFETRVLISSAA
jgi:hypothetical protein